ncbi:MAG TPA: ATP-binding cassette domain-containing protein [Planctomycetes bacterium]|nr:ATP-binding cassette domain-containing protein [Planctomycetota bacterium]
MRIFKRKPRIPKELLERKSRTEDLIRGIAIETNFDGRTVLKGVDLAVTKGEVFVILGPSGCGKTTLLRHLSGMLPPTLGIVQLFGRDLYTLKGKELAELRGRMGFSFQGGALLNSMSVLENVALPLRESTDLPWEKIERIARLKLDMVGLLHAAHLSPSSLSGGMKKRAAISRAIALDPELIFFDEPSAGLDPITAVEVDNLILKLNKVFGITMVVVTHDIPSAFLIADRMIMLHEGRVLARGTPDEIREMKDSKVQDFIHRALPAEEQRSGGLARFLKT